MRDGSKLALMIDLLRRADGATIVDLTQATGWLAHTTRAAITGLRKRGYVVTGERIVAGEPLARPSFTFSPWRDLPQIPSASAKGATAARCNSMPRTDLPCPGFDLKGQERTR